MSRDLETLRGDLFALASSPCELPPELVPDLVADLARAQAALLAAATRNQSARPLEAERPEPDRLLDVTEAAALLNVPPRWLYRHAKTLPFARKLSPKVLRFSRAGIARYLASKRP